MQEELQRNYFRTSPGVHSSSGKHFESFSSSEDNSFVTYPPPESECRGRRQVPQERQVSENKTKEKFPRGFRWSEENYWHFPP